MRLFTYAGILGICVSLITALFFLVTKLGEMFGLNLLGYKIPSGGTTLGILLLVGISLNFLGFGVVGEYVGRIFEEVKNRPHYLIRKVAYGRNIESVDKDSP